MEIILIIFGLVFGVIGAGIVIKPMLDSHFYINKFQKQEDISSFSFLEKY